MAIVTVKNKYQVVIPQRVRDEIGIAVGDVLEATVERGRVVLQPKVVIDRGIAESIAEFKAGRAHGPFGSHAAFLKALHTQAKKPVAKKPVKRAKR